METQHNRPRHLITKPSINLKSSLQGNHQMGVRMLLAVSVRKIAARYL